MASLAHRALDVLAGRVEHAYWETPTITDHCLRAFCSLLVAGKMKPALTFTRLYLSRGAGYADLAEDLFAAAARRLGDRWTRGKASTVEVNIGILTLTRVHIALCATRTEPRARIDASALFGTFPGQAHTLGLAFSAEHFHRQGWNVHYMPGTSIPAFIAAATRESSEIIGMTAALDRDVVLVQDVIQQLRALPHKPRIVIGGSASNLAQLGADAVASRLDVGFLAAHRLLEERAR
ncbi:MAG: cobalamin-dependent protein [Pseudomonadota bacterium]